MILTQVPIIHLSVSPRIQKPAMNLYALSIALLFLCFITAAGENPTHFKGKVSINCGSRGTSAALNGKEWLGDVKPKFLSLIQIKGSSSTASAVIRKHISVDPVPYKTARISRSEFSYEFQVSPGQKIIRLYFYPTPYRGFKGFKDLFTVESGPFTLLGNFSASLTADALGVNSFVKEFCLNVQENGQLIINFSPSSLDAYAFVNGIEIISVPSSLSYFHGGDVGVQVVGQKSPVYVDYDTALEIIQRLNIKKSSLPFTRDFDGMFPMWAIHKLDEEKNSTWKIPVDVGFRYLIRLHFSQLALKIVESDDVIFKVLINEIIVHTNIDIVKERNDDNIPWYRDYMVMMRGNKKEGKRDLLISLQSYDELLDGHGLLAGFEIFKLSNPDNNLASPNPFPPPRDSPSLLLGLDHKNAFSAVAITLIALVSIIVHKLREIWEASSTEEENTPSVRAERLCRHFTLAEIKLATRNFSDAFLIGKGGFGRVYKGLIDKGQDIVAVKRLKSSSNQGSHEFLTEIEMLSELRHGNLVSLIGYCNDHKEMILVYDYMAHGTLADHLYKLQRESNTSCSLTWKQRLDICIGVGRGLDYLHTGHGVIHRDVKASNILLDENFVAKVSDFGLAKPEDRSKLKSYVSTKVKGTFGYLDPCYFNTHKLTRKSDTYAFGVVLLEVLCGRPAVDSRVAENERVLSKWAQDYIRKGEVHQIIDLNLRDEISPESLKTFVGVVERCLCDEPKNRPTMSQVVLQLESTLEQQENKQNPVLNKPTTVSDNSRSCNDEIDLPVNTITLTVASPDGQNRTNKKVVNAELPSGSKGRRRAEIRKPLRLWPWDGFWNRLKTSKKNELSLSEICGTDIKLAKFDWNTLVAATNNFSHSNRIGDGEFGPIYKAVLPTGQVVAVKSFLPSPGGGFKEFTTYIGFEEFINNIGFEEFTNNILSLQNLQHRNIIKLLGYCMHTEKNILLYEFVDNGSLNDTLLGGVRHRHLQWSVRFKVIMGIARGVAYLHKDSRLNLIHRDLKPGHILLDTEMNPKISDFSLARTLEEHQSELETVRICGTFGYMAPEYVMHRIFSVKSDVYSFGIIVMQLVSGKGLQSKDSWSMFLIDCAWKLWNEGKPLDLIDESLEGEFPVEEALRCIQVGLLCIQEQSHLRPTMPSVIKMLEGDEVITQEPQKPWPLTPTEDSVNSKLENTDGGWDTEATFEFDDTLER